MDTPMKLYVKVWCPWCVKAREWLDNHGFQYELIDVEKDRSAYDEMIRISGQRLTPTLAVGDLVLPDFGPEELEAFVNEHQLTPG
jgi:glutaredoxin 3